MCAVFGYLGTLPRNDWKLAHYLLVELAIASERRGTDAFGYAALTSQGEMLWARQPGPARDLFEGKEFEKPRGRRIHMVIGHTRLATNGAPAVNGNNHPHVAGRVSEGGDSRLQDSGSPLWAVVHNGFIPAHEEKAAALKLPLHSQCDSEILVQALCRYRERAGPDVCLSFGGKQSVLAINARTRRMLAWTNGEMPLVAFRADGLPGLWWASTEEIAREAMVAVGLTARFAEAKPDQIYRMELSDGQVLVETKRVRAKSPRR
jgi:glucosamine 6-phosphate synthetase-like amidotransferase/phosphosugar isomerase protein